MMFRSVSRYLPALVALACYTYIRLKIFYDIHEVIGPQEVANLKSDIPEYVTFTVVPGILIFITSARWRIFKWMYLALLLRITYETAKTHYVVYRDCNECFYTYFGLLVVTWPVFGVVGTIAIMRWITDQDKKWRAAQN